MILTMCMRLCTHRHTHTHTHTRYAFSWNCIHTDMCCDSSVVTKSYCMCVCVCVCVCVCAHRTFAALAMSDELRLDYKLQPGDISLVNNLTLLHAKTAFKVR